MTDNKQDGSKSRDIVGVFQDMGGAAKAGRVEKVGEYHQRLLAVRRGEPSKPGDREVDLLRDFKRMSGLEWTEDFDFERFRYEQLGQSSGQKEEEAVNTLIDFEVETDTFLTEEPTKMVGSFEVRNLEGEDGVVVNFILDLARASDLSDGESVKAIVKQIKVLEKNKYFSFIIDSLDPDRYGSKVKLLDEKAKKRLRDALEQI